jgi:FAD/FMN-containing dehydrogenase
MVKPMKYPEIYPPEQEGYHPVAASRTMFMDYIDRDVAAKILQYLTSSKASMAVAQLRVLGGAMARVPADATAFAHRNSKIMVNVAALYDQPEQKETHEAWVQDFAAALQQNDTGAYVNFLGQDGEERIRAAYPNGTWERLAAIKAKYDPTNLFRLNQNIKPVME